MNDIEVNKLDLKSVDIVEENIEKIGKMFPNVIVEGEKGKSIDFELLKQELSKDIVEYPKEKYELTWPGKKDAILTANKPTTKTLRPIRKKSVDFEKTQNVYIEGDNLEALKILQESYLGKVKCIYIDPPYNTGNDFLYSDKFRRNADKELEDSGQIDEYNNRLITNNESNGRFHSDWLSMMYPRLKLSRNLLSSDGLIFISIDDNEIENLKKMCDEIYGESNFVANIPIYSNPRGRQSTELIALTHEYILIYCKSKSKCSINGEKMDDEHKKEYKYKDERGAYRLLGLRLRGGRATAEESPTLHFPIYYSKEKDEFYLERRRDDDYEIIPKFENGVLGTWRWSKNKILKQKNELVVKQVKDRYDVFQKDYLDDNKTLKVKSLWLEKEINYDNSARELKNLSLDSIFNYAKPLYLIKKIISLIKGNDYIVIDFFSGSATAAHACMQLNSEDEGKRKFIMVQLPEKCNEKSQAYKEGYRTICDIGEERIRRAANNIKRETNANIDYGFRVYEIDSSNMKDIYYKPNELKQTQLSMFESNIKEDRNSEDILTQVILDLGLTLDLKVEKKKIMGNEIYFVENNSLVACFDDKINIDIIDEICKIDPLRIVFQEKSFENDNDKINIYEKIKKMSPETEVNVI